jgi:thiosulfate/3-mercaptopyruvate sulfurtransferase
MLATLLLTVALAGPPAYAKPGLLIEPDPLSFLLGGRVVILDARPRAAYDKGHVPGARWVDLAAWNKAVLADEGVEQWARRLGDLGIDGEQAVVVYDDDRSREASRVWWMLRHWGLGDVRILNGGWQGWVKAGQKTETAAPVVVKTAAKLKRVGERRRSRDEIQELLKAGKLHQLIDARSKAEHCGEKATAKRNGAIPGAKHLEWSDTLDPKTGRFKTAPELKKLMEDAGIDPDKPTTTYCQSGGRAAVMAFVFELMSGKPAANYYRSWAEWGNDPDTPIVTPKKK